MRRVMLGSVLIVWLLVFVLAALPWAGYVFNGGQQGMGRFPQPGYIPEGFSLSSVGTTAGNGPTSMKALNYGSADGALRITEYAQRLGSDISYFYMESGRIIQEWKAGEYQVVLFDPDSPPRDGKAMTTAVRWQDGPHWFEVKGNIALEELIQVADSLMPGGL